MEREGAPPPPAILSSVLPVRVIVKTALYPEIDRLSFPPLPNALDSILTDALQWRDVLSLQSIQPPATFMPPRSGKGCRQNSGRVIGHTASVGAKLVEQIMPKPARAK